MAEALEVKGLREAQRALYAYSQQMGDRVVRAALRQGANLVLRQSRANAPKVTGALRRGLRVANSRIYNGKRSRDVIGLFLSLRKGKGRRDPRDAFYGRWVESGFKDRMGQQVEGQRFVQRAYESRKAEAVRLIVQSAIAGAESVARRTGLK